MGNGIIAGIKRFAMNKNTVTIFAVLVGIVVLWVGYSYRVGQSTKSVEVWAAGATIKPVTKIDNTMLVKVKISENLAKKLNIYYTKDNLIDLYTNVNVTISKSGFFYKERNQIVKKDEVQNSIWQGLDENYGIFYMSVTDKTTYGNSITPGTYIDLYLKGENPDTRGKIFQKYVEKIKVLEVRDSSGRNVFAQDPPTSPSLMLFAVENDLFEELTFIRELGGTFTLVPVPRGIDYGQNDGETKKVSNELSSIVQRYNGNVGN